MVVPEAIHGRVIAIGGGLAAVRVDGEERVAKLAGRLRRNERPVTGDSVDVTLMDDGSARIDAIHARTSRLVREQRLGRGDQVLVANAELLLVVVALADPPLRRGLIDRLLVAAWAGEMDAAIVITKADRASDAPEPAAGVLREYAALGYPGVAIDARTSAGVAAVRELIGGRLAALAGHSGVGKSTLVNGLTGGVQVTGAVNDVIGRGRHTTSTARLVHGRGLEVIDLPGIRGFALAGLDEHDLGLAFPEIAEAAPGCRFRGCLHAEEPGCAVGDTISPARLDSYRKLLDELRGVAPAHELDG